MDLGANVVIRMPLVRGYNDSYDAITGAINYAMALSKRGGNLQRIDILIITNLAVINTKIGDDSPY